MEIKARSRQPEQRAAARSRPEAQAAAGEALHVAEEKCRLMLEAVSDGIAVFDLEGYLTEVNARGVEMCGAGTRDDLLGKKIFELLAPHERERARTNMRARLEQGANETVEYTLLRMDGSEFPCELGSSLFRDASGEPVGFIVVVRDITERKRAEEALRGKAEQLETLLSNTGAIILEGDPFDIYFVGGRVEEILGYPRAMWFQHHEGPAGFWKEHLHPDDAGKFDICGQAIAKGEDHSFEYRMIAADGREVWFYDTVTVEVQDGKPVRARSVMVDITERKRAEEALRESEEKFRTFTQSAPDFVMQLDLSGRILFLNRTNGRAAVEEMAGHMAADWLPEEYRARFAEALARVAEKGEPQALEHPTNLTEGEVRWFSVHLGPLEVDGRVDSVLLVARDVTEHRLAQEALRESETRFRTLSAATFEGVVLTEEGRIVDANQQFLAILGYDLNELRGMEVKELVAPEDRELVEGKIFSGDEEPYEHRLIRKDGTIVFVEVRPRMMSIEGQVARVTAIRDITERKRTERRRRLATRVLELLNQHLTVSEAMRDILPLIKEHAGVEAVGIRLRDGEDFPFYCTEGFPAEFVEGERHLCARDQSGEIARDSAGNAVLECLCGGVVSGRMDPELPYLSEGGSLWTNDSSGLVASMTDAVRPHCFRGRCVREGYESLALVPLHAGPEIIGLLQLGGRREGMFTLDDIHFFERLGASIGMAFSRKRVEDALAESEERFRKVVENAAEAIIVAQDGVLKFGNARLCEFTGYTSEEVISKQFLGFIHPDDRHMVAERHAARQEGDSVPRAYPFRIIHREGHTRWVQINAAPTEWGGRPATLGLLTDITDRMKAEEEKARMEQQLHLAGRLAAVGELAAGVAHELNNPLTAIQGFAEFLSAREDLDEDTMSDIAVIYKEAQRATRVTANLLSFARRHRPQKAEISVNEALEKSLELHTYRMRVNNIEVVTDLAPDLPLVMADFHQIQQVFVNIVTNAEHAMMQTHGKGNFLIKTQQSKKAIRIVFKDDGPGIPEQNLPSLFDPFFTTKEVGQGTGLGLSICYGIVQDHGGQLWAESKSGEGATFVVELPLTTGEQPEDAHAG